MRNSLIVLLATILWSLALEATPAVAQGSYSHACPSGRIMIGLRGWQGWWMDGVQGACATISSTGSILASDVVYTQRAGGTGGLGTIQSTHFCPAGQVLTGFKGTRGSYVNSIRYLQCQPFDSSTWRTVSSPVQRMAFAYKSGSSIDGLCTSGLSGTGIRGTHGIYLDSFHVTCGAATKPTTSPLLGSRTSGSSGLKQGTPTKLPPD